MALADVALRVGPLNVPVWLIGALAGLVVSLILQRTVFAARRESRRMTNDALLSGLLAFILGWKLAPLVTRFSEIAERPGRLLYYPGGTTGLVLGVVAALAVIAVRTLRGRLERSWTTVSMLAVPVAFVALGWAVPAAIPVGERASYDLRDIESLPSHPIVLMPDRPTLIVVWATWCGPCSAQMPEVQRFHDEHPGFNVIALNLTRTEPSVGEVEGYLSRYRLDFPVGLDRSGQWGAKLEVASTPTLIVVGPDGTERFRHSGAVNYDWLTRRVLPFSRRL